MKLYGLMIIMFLANSVDASEELAPINFSDIEQDCGSIGKYWKSTYGIKVDNLSNIGTLSPQEQTVVKKLRNQIQPLGVIAVADYSCVANDGSLNIATVRVFAFENRERALIWWRKKYEYNGWEQHYTKVEGASYLGVDSKQLQKRAITYSNLWITAHHLKKGNEHLLLLDDIISKLGK